MAPQPADAPACSPLWQSFVQAFTDQLHARGRAAPPPPVKAEVGPAVLPAVARIVAIGDLHGDMDKTRRAFRVGGLIDEHDRWAGGTTTAVQVGDQLDRGDDELPVLYFLERLAREAQAAGGALHVLNGNHETMSVGGRYTYATAGAVQDYERWQRIQQTGAKLRELCGCISTALTLAARPPAAPADGSDGSTAPARGRAAAMDPGGPVTRRFFARHPVVLQIGSNLFVHGGLLPDHASLGLEHINRVTTEWMEGDSGKQMPDFLNGREAVVWARTYSAEDPERCDCDTLQTALGMVPGADRMVVGHTIQRAGINSTCDGRVHRIDVGLSKGCGDGTPQVLEILNDSQVRRLSERPAAQAAQPLPTEQTQTSGTGLTGLQTV